MSHQKLILIGRLGQDPEMRFSGGGKPYTKFSVAVNGYRKEDPPTWFRCTAFDKKAEIANEYLHKGGLVYIEGRISLNEFVGKDGMQHASLDVTVDTIVLIGDRGNRTSDSNGTYNPGPANLPPRPPAAGSGVVNTDDDNVPF